MMKLSAFCLYAVAILSVSVRGFLPPSTSSWNRIPSRQPRISENAVPSSMRTVRAAGSNRQYQQVRLQAVNVTEDRWERTPSLEASVSEPCILTIGNHRYNLTAWANAHPGGVAVLQKFNGKNATKAFHAAQHSEEAIAMLQAFLIDGDGVSEDSGVYVHSSTSSAVSTSNPKRMSRWRRKLFTKEDPVGFHKFFGVFCLLHFAFRFYQMYFQDISAGFGSRMGRGPSWVPLACLVPHALLSLSSLIFHTVPRDRVVGKPMIWKEYRIHNIGFGLRSVVATLLASIAVRYRTSPRVVSLAVAGSCAVSLAALVVADVATAKLRPGKLESTTATMPYWEGCSQLTQRRFKSFYAYTQFMATLACIATGNPAFPFAVLFAIQFASLLLTLVRKGFLSARGLHYLYASSLLAVYFVGIRSLGHSPLFIAMTVLGAALYQLRRRGVNKYFLWIPVFVARMMMGGSILDYNWY